MIKGNFAFQMQRWSPHVLSNSNSIAHVAHVINLPSELEKHPQNLAIFSLTVVIPKGMQGHPWVKSYTLLSMLKSWKYSSSQKDFQVTAVLSLFTGRPDS